MGLSGCPGLTGVLGCGVGLSGLTGSTRSERGYSVDLVTCCIVVINLSTTRCEFIANKVITLFLEFIDLTCCAVGMASPDLPVTSSVVRTRLPLVLT